MQHDQSLRWTVLSLLLGAICLLGISPSAQAQAPETLQVTQLLKLGTPPPVPALGAARLTRARNALGVTVHASDLDAHTAYTVWIVVFNRPSACTTNPAGAVRCGGPDLALTPNLADASAFNVGAFITDGEGTANVSIDVRSGLPPDGAAVLFGEGGIIDNGVQPGLRAGNGFGAEVHFIIREHGDLLPHAIADQLSAFNGGCPPNACANAQVVMFPHVQD